jgi:hypothetical protein
METGKIPTIDLPSTDEIKNHLIVGLKKLGFEVNHCNEFHILLGKNNTLEIKMEVSHPKLLELAKKKIDEVGLEPKDVATLNLKMDQINDVTVRPRGTSVAEMYPELYDSIKKLEECLPNGYYFDLL